MATNTNRYFKVTTMAAACLIKTLDGKVKIGAPFMIAPEQEVTEYISHGFIQVACPKDMGPFQEFVRQLCDKTNNLPRLNPDLLIGSSRERACASARAGLAEAISK
jgi:hypothetical protein